MPAPTPCPPPEALEKLALGADAPPPISQHLESCESCRRELERIREDNRLLCDFAVGGALPSVAPPVRVPGYEIVREIHRGGQGVVYLARQHSTRRDVAIKVMKHGPFATPADRARFEREIETLGRLKHPNIVSVHDAGEIGGASYYVMDYIDGLPLDEAVLNLPQAELLETFARVCDAVHAAHLLGVIHRDLKPSNIRVDRAGEPHVLDFGLAKSLSDEVDMTMTRTGQFLGSLPWASPEQVEGASARIDLRSDVYSLGAVLYQLLTGAPPFDAGSNLRVAMDDILQREPTPPSALAGRSPRRGADELDTIVLKSLSKDPERRYQSAGDFARDLRRFLADEPIEARRDSAMYVLRKTLRRYRGVVSAASGAVLTLVLLTVLMTLLYQRSARLEGEAVRSAERFATLLAQSNIEQARMSGLLGDMQRAENVLWNELLIPRSTSGNAPATLNPPPGPLQAYWALWELYARFPCRRTLIPLPKEDRFMALDDSGAGQWTVDRDGRFRLIDPYGVELRSYPPSAGMLTRARMLSLRGSVAFQSDGVHLRLQRLDPAPVDLFELAAPLTIEVGAAQLSRNGRFIATASDGAVYLRNTQSPGDASIFTADIPLSVCAISNDERRIASRDARGGLHLWDIASGERVVHVPPGAPRAMAHEAGLLLFSPDDMALADLWMEIPGRIWNLRKDPPTFVELNERPGDYRVANFDRSSAQLAVGDLGGAVRIFDCATGNVVSGFSASADRIRNVEFTPDARSLWICGGGEMRLWDVTTADAIRVFRMSNDVFHGVDISPDGRWLFATSVDGGLYRVDLVTGEESAASLKGADTVSSIAVAANGARLAASTYEGGVFVWDGLDPTQPEKRLPHPNRVSHVSLSADGNAAVTACDDGAARVWRTADGKLLHTFELGDQRLPQAEFSPDGARVAAAARDGSLWMIDLGNATTRLWAEPDNIPLRAVRFSRDGRWLVSGGARRVVQVWDATNGRRTEEAPGHNQEIYCVDISADNTMIASGDSGGRIRLWTLEPLQLLTTLEGHNGAVMEVRFAPDGRSLASASLDGSVRVWRLGVFEQHIAGQVESRLRHANLLNAPGADAWREWAARVMRLESGPQP